MMMYWILGMLLPLVLGGSAQASPIREEQEWIARLQRPSGAIAMTPGGDRINPYFANLALMGLAGDDAYDEVIRRWAYWVVEHLNDPDAWGLRGSIYDYRVQLGQEVSTGDYDSSDSYAATFVSLLWAHGNWDLIRELQAELEMVVQAIYGTWDEKDNLTYAKPNYPVKFLMDNAEVYRGLLDWAEILDLVYGEPERALLVRSQAEDVRQGLLSLWQRNSFAYAKDNGGNLSRTNWSRWYPDATAQLFPIAFGVIEPADPRAQQLWDWFNQSHPQWVSLGHPDAFPWTVVGYVAVLMEDWERVEAYVQAVRQRFRWRQWTWHAGEAGWFIRILKGIEDR